MTDSLERYLEELRGRLRPLPAAEVAEIVEELRSHVRDSSPSGATDDGEVAAALERLGSAEELASLYVRDRLFDGARHSRSPFVLAEGMFRWATLSMAGFFAFLGLLAGYVVSLSFFIAALHDPIAPDRVGLWRLGDSLSLHLGFGSPGSVPQGEELLGFWIIPIGLLAGGMCAWLTHSIARWCVRSLRRPPLHRVP